MMLLSFNILQFKYVYSAELETKLNKRFLLIRINTTIQNLI